MDVLRDADEVHALKLDAAGVPLIAVRYNHIITNLICSKLSTEVAGARGATEQSAKAIKIYEYLRLIQP